MAPVTITLNERPLYDLEWLEDCYKKVKFPNPKCEEFLVEVNAVLSQKISGELDNQVKQQALFQLLGEDYVRIHFPHHKYNPAVLENIRPELKKQYNDEMKALVEQQLDNTLKDLKYPKDVSTYKGENQLGEFLEEVRKVFKTELDNQIKLAADEERLKDIENDAASAIGDDDDEEDAVPLDAFQKADVPGEAFVAASKINDGQLDLAVQMFRERVLMLPQPVRHYVWSLLLYEPIKTKSDKIKHIDVNSQCRDFKGVVQRKVTGQRQRAVQSPEYSRIYGEVIDSFHSTKHLKSWGDESLMLNIAHVLNVMYYVNDKSYSNAQIFWLIPLELVFPKVEDLTQDDYIIRLASHLNAFGQNCMVSWERVHSLAEEVLNLLKRTDPEYHKCLVEGFEGSHSSVDIHNFAYEILHKDSAKSRKIWTDLEKKKQWKDKDFATFNDPHIYIRKWISEAFVGVFSGHLLLLIWDYLFLGNWRSSCLKNVAYLTLSLIRPWAMQANTPRKLSRVLLNEPNRLYLGDFRKALTVLKEGGDLKQLHKLNTNIEFVKPTPPPTPPPPAAEPEPAKPPTPEPEKPATPPPEETEPEPEQPPPEPPAEPEKKEEAPPPESPKEEEEAPKPETPPEAVDETKENEPKKKPKKKKDKAK